MNEKRALFTKTKSLLSTARKHQIPETSTVPKPCRDERALSQLNNIKNSNCLKGDINTRKKTVRETRYASLYDLLGEGIKGISKKTWRGLYICFVIAVLAAVFFLLLWFD